MQLRILVFARELSAKKSGSFINGSSTSLAGGLRKKKQQNKTPRLDLEGLNLSCRFVDGLGVSV